MYCTVAHQQRELRVILNAPEWAGYPEAKPASPGFLWEEAAMHEMSGTGHFSTEPVDNIVGNEQRAGDNSPQL
jgi:hypothetical protein